MPDEVRHSVPSYAQCPRPSAKVTKWNKWKDPRIDPWGGSTEGVLPRIARGGESTEGVLAIVTQSLACNFVSPVNLAGA